MMKIVYRAVRLAALAAAAATALASVACDSGDDETPVGYSIDFPSTAAAVAVDSVKIYLFSPQVTDCAKLIQARRARSLLPPALSETRLIAPCDLLAGGGEVTVDVGNAILFGVAQKGGDDFLIGCTAARRLDESTRDLSLSLTPFDPVDSVPETACLTLSDKCGGRC